MKFADWDGNVVMEGRVLEGNDVVVDAVKLVNYIGGTIESAPRTTERR